MNADDNFCQILGGNESFIPFISHLEELSAHTHYLFTKP